MFEALYIAPFVIGLVLFMTELFKPEAKFCLRSHRHLTLIQGKGEAHFPLKRNLDLYRNLVMGDRGQYVGKSYIPESSH